MEHAHIVYSRTLATIVVLVAVTAVCAGSSAISLDVSSRVDSSCRRVGLVLTCIIHTDAGIDKVTSLAVFGTRPYANEPGLQQIAVLDNSAMSPKLAEDLKKSNISVHGNLGSDHKTPHLALVSPFYKFSTRHVYRCVATGNGSDEQAISISKTAQIEAMDTVCEKEKLQAKLSGTLKDTIAFSNMIEKVASKILSLAAEAKETEPICTSTLGKTRTYFEAWYSSLAELHNNISELFVDGSSFSEKGWKTLENKVKELRANLSSFKQNINRKFLKFGIGASDEFQVSRIHQGREYLLTKKWELFNIAKANKYCRKFGGYLVEIDDEDEMTFVQNCLDTDDDEVHFWTGVNDIDKEGKFVFYHSKKPVPKLKWAHGQPDNYGDIEDCAEIIRDGLNDLPCNSGGRVICEIPIIKLSAWRTD
ncbi:hypothetical protein RRG08_009767 [Elysia crispata]|uniref:C-type lectin domain-containing protein n=1 Tax=Elysia crispata TaxID=231223 RepID=A0AAE1DL48_9GAST|nr:hypothetical protein RRG08_009767 [Elysia crispata]